MTSLFRKALVACGAVATCTTVAALPAAAHVTIMEQEATAGAYTILTFGIPHGCDESPTTKVDIEIPEDIVSVTPTVSPNWTVTRTMEQLATPIEGEGDPITERTATVSYTATTPLPADLRDAFQLSVKMPDEADDMLFFPVVQTCEQGQTAWVQVPEDGQDPFELDTPSPFIPVAASSESGHGGSDTTDMNGAEAETVSAETAAAPSSDSSDSNGLAIAALVVGAIGIVLGGVALAAARRTT